MQAGILSMLCIIASEGTVKFFSGALWLTGQLVLNEQVIPLLVCRSGSAALISLYLLLIPFTCVDFPIHFKSKQNVQKPYADIMYTYK